MAPFVQQSQTRIVPFWWKSARQQHHVKAVRRNAQDDDYELCEDEEQFTAAERKRSESREWSKSRTINGADTDHEDWKDDDEYWDEEPEGDIADEWEPSDDENLPHEDVLEAGLPQGWEKALLLVQTRFPFWTKRIFAQE